MSIAVSNHKDTAPNSFNHYDQPPLYETTFASSIAPLHSDEALIASALPLRFPDAAAAAPDVRTYIRSYLSYNATKYGLDEADVVRVSNAWKHGSGQELRNYDQATWQGLFGMEIGSIIMKHVARHVEEEKRQVARHVEEEKMQVGLRKYGLELGFTISSLVVLAITGPWALLGSDDLGVHAVWYVFIPGPCGLALVIAIASMCNKRLVLAKITARAKGEYTLLEGDEDAVPLERV